MPDWLYDGGPHRLWIFLLLTVLLGGGAAIVAGRAMAQTWRPLWQVPMYTLLIALTVRFLHFALFEEPLLSLKSFLFDFVVLVALATLGFRRMRVLQISTQYSWLYAPAGLFGWRRRDR
jgi:hypothetical protein